MSRVINKNIKQGSIITNDEGVAYIVVGECHYNEDLVFAIRISNSGYNCQRALLIDKKNIDKKTKKFSKEEDIDWNDVEDQLKELI